MSDLIIYIFDKPSGAAALKEALLGFQSQTPITYLDAAIVQRQADGTNSMYTASSLAGAGRWGGSFWGMFFALVFWAKWWDLNIGAALNDLDMDDEFVKAVGDALGKDSSALLIVVPEGTAYQLQTVLQNFTARVVKAVLSPAAEARLDEIFMKEA